MGGYLWLVWYEAASKLTPKHWTLAVTYEAHDRAYATVYEVSRSWLNNRCAPLTTTFLRLPVNTLVDILLESSDASI